MKLAKGWRRLYISKGQRKNFQWQIFKSKCSRKREAESRGSLFEVEWGEPGCRLGPPSASEAGSSPNLRILSVVTLHLLSLDGTAAVFAPETLWKKALRPEGKRSCHTSLLSGMLPEVLSTVSVGPRIPHLSLESFWNTLPCPNRNLMQVGVFLAMLACELRVQ